MVQFLSAPHAVELIPNLSIIHLYEFHTTNNLRFCLDKSKVAYNDARLFYVTPAFRVGAILAVERSELQESVILIRFRAKTLNRLFRYENVYIRQLVELA
ncbi:hypothetical protein ES705_13413 [subsurface metagenome]